MSQFVIILGRTGSGKSTSIKNLDPSKTYIFNCLGKTLPFKGSAKAYNKEANNYVKTYKYDNILRGLDHVNTKLPDVKTCIIDDATFIMKEEFFDRSGERGYEKYSELADHFRQVINKARSLRDDLHVYMMLHDENIETDGSIEAGTYKVTVEETETYGILLYWDNKVQEYLPFKTNEDSYYNFGFPVVVANGKVPPSLALGSIVDSYSDSITPDYYGPRNYSVTIAEENSGS